MIIAKGAGIERLINICTKREILLWDIVRREDAVVMKVSLKGFKLMRPAVKKSGCHIHIQKKCGLPFFFNRYRKRNGFKVGIFLCLSLMVLSTSIIWDIEIRGCDEDMAQKVLNVLNTERISKGTFKFGLNAKKLSGSILSEIDDVAWAGVELKGVKLIVEVRDTTPKPEVINPNEAFNIVAEHDGVIINMVVLAGLAKVKEGDTVRKGQLLVSGKLESKYQENGTKDVHALGSVIARTWYESTTPVTLEYTKRFRTGNVERQSALTVLDAKLRLPGKKQPYALYDSEVVDKPLFGPFGMKLPFGMTQETFYEVNEKKVQLSLEDAEALALENVRESLQESIPADCRIMDEQIDIVKDDTGQEFVKLVVECEEDIAWLQPLGGD